MADPVASQVMVFVYTILTGALAGLFYDIYAGVGQVLGLRKIGVLIGDVFYWLALTPVVFALMLFYNQGEVRFFVLLGLVLGTALYFMVFRQNIRKLVVQLILLIIRIVRLVIKVLSWLLSVLLLPFKIVAIIIALPFKLLSMALRLVGRGLAALLRLIMPAPVKRVYRRLFERWSNFKAKLSRLISKINFWPKLIVLIKQLISKRKG